MQFNQFIIAPYIGDGSPVAQSLSIDDVLVAAARQVGGSPDRRLVRRRGPGGNSRSPATRLQPAARTGAVDDRPERAAGRMTSGLNTLHESRLDRPRRPSTTTAVPTASVQDASVPGGAGPCAGVRLHHGSAAGGRAPATHFYPLHRLQELLVGLEWKVSEPWRGTRAASTRFSSVYTGSSDVAMVMYGQNERTVRRARSAAMAGAHGAAAPNATTAPIIPGRWHRLEWYFKYESQRGAADGDHPLVNRAGAFVHAGGIPRRRRLRQDTNQSDVGT